MVVVTHADSRQVHHLQSTSQHLLIGNLVKLRSRRILLRISRIHTVHTCALQHHVGLNLDATQARARICGEVRRSRTCREDAHIPLLHGLDGLPLGVELTDGLHTDGRHHLVLHTHGPQCRTQRQRVDHRSAHTHLVALHTVEALLRARESTEDVTTANHDANLHAHLTHFLDLLSVVAQTLRVDTVALLAHQALTRQLQ